MSENWDAAATNEATGDLEDYYALEEFEEDSEEGFEQEIVDTADEINEKAGPKPQELEHDDETEFIQDGDVTTPVITQRQASVVPRFRVTSVREEEEEPVGNDRGLVWQVKIFKDGYKDKRFTHPDGTLKQRRAVPQISASEFFGALKKTSDGRYIYRGALNGWPAMDNLELVNLEFWYRKQMGSKSATYTKRYWKKVEGGKREPAYPKAGSGFFINAPKSVRATLKSPPWSEIGYSPNNAGFTFYYAQFREGGAKMAHGENMVQAIQDDAKRVGKPIAKAVRAHYFGHRYVKRKEKLKDRVTYHTGVLIEWDHGKFTTVVELAYLRGLGGYAGNSSWIDESFNKKLNKMYEAMPDCIKAPWDVHRSEVRIIDHVSKDLKEFKEYLKKYEGKRYQHSEIKASADVRLGFRQLDHIAQYCNNYSFRDTEYSEARRNCQTFAVDFWTFLTGKVKDAEPYYPIKVIYVERRHLFLYEPSLFEKKKKERGVVARVKKNVKKRL